MICLTSPVPIRSQYVAPQGFNKRAAAASWSLVQSTTCTAAGVALSCCLGTACTAPTASNVASGDLLVFITDANLTYTSASDTVSSSYAQAGSTCASGGGISMQLYYAVAASGSTANTTTVTPTSRFADGLLMEFNGNAASSVLDAAGSCTTFTSTTTVAPTVTSSVNSDLLIGLGENDQGATLSTVTSGYTKVTGIHTQNVADGFRNTSGPASGLQTLTITSAFSSSGVGQLFCFKHS